jgi:dipeptidyl aminopeptidase/acylaminoacyl peptidase
MKNCYLPEERLMPFKENYAFFKKIRAVFLAIVALMVIPGFVFSQEDSLLKPIYRMPPEEIVNLVDAPRTPWVYVGPNNEWLLMLGRPNLPPIEEVAQPELRLAGLRINPLTNGPSRAYYGNSLTLKNISDGREVEVANLPAHPRIAGIQWSPDGRRIAFTTTGTDRIELWLADVKSGRAKKVPGLVLNDAYGTPYYWLSDSRTLVCKTVPPDRGAPPEESTIPTGPVIQENIGKAAPAVTYADLLKDAHDEALFEYYLRTQLVLVDSEGKNTSIGPTDLITRAEPSPDDEYILVEVLHRPFSYLVTASRFPKRVEIWDSGGKFVRSVIDQPLADDIPTVTGAVRRGPREFEWRSDAEATLYFAEALDKGDPRTEADVRDQIYTLKAPFKGNPIPFFALALRYETVRWCNDDLAFISEWWWKTRQLRVWAFAPGSPRVEPEVIFDYTWEDRYNHPGWPVMVPNEAGRYVLLTVDDGRSILLSGDGASPEGDFPFLDKLDLVTRKTERLWRCEAPYYEAVVRVLDTEKPVILTRRESIEEPLNYFVRDVRDEKIEQLTGFPHPTPQLLGIQKELVKYEREDGLTLDATLYLPAGYTPDDGPLPAVVWAYPREFKSADAAGQVTNSPYRFVRVSWSSPMLWVTRGYAVLDRASMPIIGEGDEEPNDTFMEQLVANSKAAIDELVRRGVADPDRVAVGGGSYGAFMTANLLAHSDLFRAGLALTGAYNRTLTPFGFQNEDRSLWEAPEIYFEMSPFMHADKVDEPILLFHGTADNNPGTFPMQSERFYNAVKGHGGTARLVMLPEESHIYRARESVMHVLWEINRWLEKYVRNAPPREIQETEIEEE